MKSLITCIQEGLRINKSNKTNIVTDSIDDNEVLKKILDTLYIQKSIDDFWKEGFVDKDYDSIKKVIYEKFVKEYELNDPDKLMFVCRRGGCPKEYTKYYKKDNSLWTQYRHKLDHNNYIWAKRSLYFDAVKNDTEAILGKHGPLGGLMICVYEFN